jgi:phosphate starvation-inducible PhoH-like protein
MTTTLTFSTLSTLSYGFKSVLKREMCIHMKQNNIQKYNKLNVNLNNYIPKTSNQRKYVSYLNDNDVHLIFAIGPAGTGKTLFACLNAIQLLKAGDIQKIVLTRPIVPVDDEELGFLPGNINKKMEPWTQPIFDIFLEFFPKHVLNDYINNGVIEVSPLAFMRGRTFKNSFIIADEMQNSSPNQMKMLTTRIGINSKMVITGDLTQTDKVSNMNNGLSDLLYKVTNYSPIEYINDNIKVIDFDKTDIERSLIVQKIINIYDYKQSNNNSILDSALMPKQHISHNFREETISFHNYLHNSDLF